MGNASLGQRSEQRLVQEFVPQAPIEALDEGILHGFARCDVVPFDAAVISPGQDSVAGEFAAIVANHHLRLARSIITRSSSRATRTPESEVSATSARQSRVRSSTTVRTRKRRPSVSWSATKSSDQRSLGATGTIIGVLATAAHSELLFPIKPEELLVLDHISFRLRRTCRRRYPKRRRSCAIAFMRWRRAASSARVVLHLIVTRQQPMALQRQPFTHPESFSQTGGSFRSAAGVTISFPKILQRRIVQHGVGQQRFEARVFLSLSVFSRLASETSIPPNIAFHL